jgi:hypothetical protein
MIYQPTKKELQELNNLRNWFLFSTNSQYSESDRYKNTMKEERLEKALKQGGLNLWKIDKRVEIQQHIMWKWKQEERLLPIQSDLGS